MPADAAVVAVEVEAPQDTDQLIPNGQSTRARRAAAPAARHQHGQLVGPAAILKAGCAATVILVLVGVVSWAFVGPSNTVGQSTGTQPSQPSSPAGTSGTAGDSEDTASSSAMWTSTSCTVQSLPDATLWQAQALPGVSLMNPLDTWDSPAELQASASDSIAPGLRTWSDDRQSIASAGVASRMWPAPRLLVVDGQLEAQAGAAGAPTEPESASKSAWDLLQRLTSWSQPASVQVPAATVQLHVRTASSPSAALPHDDQRVARRAVERACQELQRPRLQQVEPAALSSAAASAPGTCTQAKAAAAALALQPFVAEQDGSVQLKPGWAAALFEAVGSAVQDSPVPACVPVVVRSLQHIVIAADRPAAPACGNSTWQEPWASLLGTDDQAAACDAAARPALGPQATWQEAHALAVHSGSCALGATPSSAQLSAAATWGHTAWLRAANARQLVLPAVQPGTRARSWTAAANASAIPGCELSAAPADTAVLRGQSVHGITRAMSALLHTFRADGVLPARGLSLVDAPRFAWRGFMLDTARHWHPPEQIMDMLDHMEHAHQNVLHWHMGDSQALPLPIHLAWNASAVQALLASGQLAQDLAKCSAQRCQVNVQALNQTAWAALGSADALHARLVSLSEIGLAGPAMPLERPAPDAKPAFAAPSATHLHATLSSVFTAPLKLQHVYFAEQVEAIIQAAAARSIRVVMELDSPAHTGSWAWAWGSWARAQMRAWAAASGQPVSPLWASPSAGEFVQDASWQWYDVERGPHTAEWAGVPPRADRSVTARAAARGYITAGGLVVPCFDTTRPESTSDSYVHGADKYALHPGHPGVDAVLSAVLHALASMNPDPVLHLGGDEVAPACWAESDAVLSWAKAHAQELGMRAPTWTDSQDFPAYHADSLASAALTYMLQRLAHSLSDSGLALGVWQGAYDAAQQSTAGQLPPGMLVQAWKCWSRLDRAAIQRAVTEGRPALRSSCWYLDYDDTAEQMYAHDAWSGEQGGASASVPSGLGLPWSSSVRAAAQPSTSMPAAGLQHLWGGEVAMWSERVVPSTLACRAWPRAAVVGERLWSWAPLAVVLGPTGNVTSLQLSIRSWHHAAPRLAAWTRSRRRLVPARAQPSSYIAQLSYTGQWGTASDACPLVNSAQHHAQGVASDLPGVSVPSVLRAPRTLRVLQFNIANGGAALENSADVAWAAQLPFFQARQGQPRLAAVLDWIRSRAADVVSLVELNGWESDSPPAGTRRLLQLVQRSACAPQQAQGHQATYYSAARAPACSARRALQAGIYTVTSSTALRAAAAKAGLPHGALLVTPAGYHVGVLSRWNIEVLEWNAAKFQRGMLVVRTGGVVYVVVHLHAHSALSRRSEAQLVAAAIQRWSAAGTLPLAVLGDFNTLSPADADWHQQQGMLQWMHQPELPARIRSKHLVSDGSAIDYAPMQTLLDAGVADLCSVTHWPADTGNQANRSIAPEAAHRGAGPCLYTEPTAYSLVKGIAPQDMPAFRLDYVLGSPALSSATGLACAVVQTAETAALSDHYPLECAGAWANG